MPIWCCVTDAAGLGFAVVGNPRLLETSRRRGPGDVALRAAACGKKLPRFFLGATPESGRPRKPVEIAKVAPT